MDSNNSEPLPSGIHMKLILLFMLLDEGHSATISRISDRVRIVPITVGALLAELEESDWVQVSETLDETAYSLTEVGRSGALDTLRRTFSETFFELAANLGLSRAVLDRAQDDNVGEL